MKWFSVAGLIGFILVLYGVISAVFYANTTWYSYFVIGVTLFLGYINYRLDNESILRKRPVYILKTFAFYLVIAVVIELIGRFWLNLWNYPSFNLTDEIIHVFLIGYPFAFFSIYESFVLLRKRFSFIVTIILTTLINGFAHEIPNTFAWEWVYTVSFGFEILQINILAIIAWTILIAVPLLGKRTLG